MISAALPRMSTTDRLDLLELYARYAWAYDGGHAEEYAALFTPDGRFERPGAEPVCGRGDLAGLVTAAQGRGSGYTHVTSNVVVAATSDGASGRAYVVLLRIEPGAVSLLAAGRYHDEFVRMPDGWRISTRRFEPATGPELAGAVIAGGG